MVEHTHLDDATKLRLQIRNGYQNSASLFTRNARAKEITLKLIPSGLTSKHTLKDAEGWQTVTVDQMRGPLHQVTHTCRDCHTNTPGKHGYAGSHDLGMLQQALSFDVCRKGNQVTATLTNTGAGHKVPTGEVHRHIVVKIWRSTAPEKLKQAFYGRRFEPLFTGGKTTIWNSSMPPNTYRRFLVDARRLGGAASEELNVEVRYLYGSRESYRPPFKEVPSKVIYRVRKTLSEIAACASTE